jgi:hypothetical protein
VQGCPRRREKKQDPHNNNLLLARIIIKGTQLQKISQQATVFLTKVSNIFVTSNSGGVTRLPHTITRMQIVPHRRTSSGNFLVTTHAPRVKTPTSPSGRSQNVSTQTAEGGYHVIT